MKDGLYSELFTLPLLPTNDGEFTAFTKVPNSQKIVDDSKWNNFVFITDQGWKKKGRREGEGDGSGNGEERKKKSGFKENKRF